MARDALTARAVKDLLARHGVTLRLEGDGSVTCVADSAPDSSILDLARKHRTELVAVLMAERDQYLAKYQAAEGKLEASLWPYIRHEGPHIRHEGLLVEVDVLEETLRGGYAVSGCISRHGRCTQEQIEARLCCDACRQPGVESKERGHG